ncbi:UNVERIFIED_ORG: hypothetical protein BCL66_105146 [Martelella mediterranea]
MSKFIFTHDSLADLIEWKHPTLQRNRDFLTAHTCYMNSAEQKGDAFIAGWFVTNIEPPNIAELLQWKTDYEATTEPADTETAED